MSEFFDKLASALDDAVLDNLILCQSLKNWIRSSFESFFESIYLFSDVSSDEFLQYLLINNFV